jgi:hypothetical protein
VIGVCLLVADVVRATLPATEFGVAWEHSVARTRWEERYRVDGNRLELVEARVQGMGAGMEPPPGAVLRDGWWRWQVRQDTPVQLRLTYSAFTSDYRVCWNQHCSDLADLLGPRLDEGAVVSVEPCAAGDPKPPPK